MLLKEFFGNTIKANNENSNKSEANEIFWFILDHDKIHKDFVMPILNNLKKKKTLSNDEVDEVFMPLVNKGCKEFYLKNNMTGHLKKKFPKPLRMELCNQLYNHYCDSITK